MTAPFAFRDDQGLRASINRRRAVDEWIGATPDTPIPPRVKLRIWEREEGRCYLSGRLINPAADAYEFEHVIAICNGGENRERNIRLALKDKHVAKTAVDVDLKAKTDRMRKKHLGIKTGRGFRKHPTKKRTVDGRVVERRA